MKMNTWCLSTAPKINLFLIIDYETLWRSTNTLYKLHIQMEIHYLQSFLHLQNMLPESLDPKNILKGDSNCYNEFWKKDFF